MVADDSDCCCPTKVEKKKGPASKDSGSENSAGEPGEGATATHRGEEVCGVHFAGKVGRERSEAKTRTFKWADRVITREPST